MTPVPAPLAWNAGLAAAGQTLFDSWEATGVRGLVDKLGGDTQSRAWTHGTLNTSSLAEYATYVTVTSWTYQDALNALIIADGDSYGVVRTSLFDPKNTQASCFNGFAEIDGTTFMMEFQAA